jgi:MFS family permease
VSTSISTQLSSPTQDETNLTIRLERLRAIALGIFESAQSTFLLLILVRWFDGSNAEKSLIASAYQSGLLVTPLILYLTRRLALAPSQAMSCLFGVAAALYALAAIIPNHSAFVIFTSIGSLMHAASSPLMTTMMYANYPSTRRGLIHSQNNSIRLATSIIFASLAGWALSGRLAYYQCLIALYAFALAVAAYLLWRIPRCGGALIERPMLECFTHIKVDRILRDTLIAWMFLGFGNLMMLPLRIEYLANKAHGLDLSEVEITLLVATIPHLARLLASPMWGRLFDRLNFFSLRITVNIFFLLSVFSFFSSSSFGSLALAATIFGFSNSGGDVAWNLWVTKFAPPSLVPDYMVVHTFFTGVRGVIAPMVAFALLGVLPLTTLMWISAALMSFATIQMFFIRERSAQKGS